MRLILVLLFVTYTNGYLTGNNTLVPGTIIDNDTALIYDFHGYFWDDPDLGGTDLQEAGRINGDSIAIPYFRNNANKSVVELFGKPENINRFCVSRNYLKYTERIVYTSDWIFQFNAVLHFNGFQEYDLIFYDDIEKKHIVTLEHRGISNSIRIGELNHHSWDRSDFKNPSGFNSLVNKIIDNRRILFYLEFKVLHITVPTTFDPVLETTSADTSFPVTATIPFTSSATTPVDSTIGKTSVVETQTVITSSPNNLDMSIDEQVEDDIIPTNMDWGFYIFLPIALTFMVFIVYLVRNRRRIRSATVEPDLESI